MIDLLEVLAVEDYAFSGTSRRATRVTSKDSVVSVLFKPSKFFKQVFKSRLENRHQTVRSLEGFKNFYLSGLELQHRMYRDDIEEIEYSCLYIPEEYDCRPFLTEMNISYEDIIYVETATKISYNKECIYRPHTYYGGKFGKIRINGINYSEFQYFVDNLKIIGNLPVDVQILYRHYLTPEQNLERLASFMKVAYHVNIKLSVNA